MSAQARKRFSFPELLARQGRILTFQATFEDYEALGWWDLVWGLTLTWILTVLPAEGLPEFLDFAGEGLRRTALGLRSLEAVLLAALLRPKGVSVWRLVPLYNLTSVSNLLFFNSAAWSINSENLPFADQIFFWMVNIWQILVVVRFLQDGLQLRPLPTTIAAVLPISVRTIVQQHWSGYILLPLLLLYLFLVIWAWLPKRRSVAEAVGDLEGKG